MGAGYWFFMGGSPVTGIGVPSTRAATSFIVVGGNSRAAFAAFNPSTMNAAHIVLTALNGSDGSPVASATKLLFPGAQTSFNASDLLTGLPTNFYGSFAASSDQPLGWLGLGVQFTKESPIGYELYSVPSFENDASPFGTFSGPLTFLTGSQAGSTAMLTINQFAPISTRHYSAIATGIFGGQTVSSFFDIFTEITVDGGVTWSNCKPNGGGSAFGPWPNGVRGTGQLGITSPTSIVITGVLAACDGASAGPVATWTGTGS